MLKGFVDVDDSTFLERVAPDSVTRGYRYKLVFVLMFDNISLQFELFQFEILFRQMFLRSSRFLVSRHASLERIWQDFWIYDCIFTIFNIAVFTIVLCFLKLYFIRVMESASLDHEASLSVLSHTTLHLCYNDTAYMRFKKTCNLIKK